MKSNIKNPKQVIKNTIVLYIRQFFILFLNLYTVRQVLIVLGEQDYGVYIVVAGIVSMFSVLSGAMSGACQRFFSFDLGLGDYDKLNKSFTMALLIHFIISIAVVVLTETIGLWFVMNKLSIPDGRYNAAVFVYQTAIIVLVLTIFVTPYIAIVLANEDMNIYAAISIIEAVLKLVFIVLISFCRWDRLILYGISFVIVELLIVGLYIFFRKIRYSSLKLVKGFYKDLFRELSAFAVWNLFGALIYPLKVQGVNIIYNQIFSTAVVPGRGVAASVSSAVTTFCTNFSNAISPQIVKRYASNGIEGVKSIVYAGSKLTYLLMFAIIFPMISEMDVILRLWLGNIPKYAIIFSQLSLIETLLISVSEPLSALVNATGRIRKYQIVVGGLQLCNLPLTIIILFFSKNPLATYLIAITLAFIGTLSRIGITAEVTSLKRMDYLINVMFRLAITSGLFSILVFVLKRVMELRGITNILFYILFEIILIAVSFVFCFDKKEKELIKKIIKERR